MFLDDKQLGIAKFSDIAGKFTVYTLIYFIVAFCIIS